MERESQVVELSPLERVLLVAMVLVFGGVALCGWFAPGILFDPIGVSFSEPAGPAEVRAAYGGLFGATALMFVSALREPERARAAFAFGATVLAGFVFGRLYSLGVDGLPSAPVAWLALSFESLGLVSCVAALRRRRAS
jgi:hypothetical protein